MCVIMRQCENGDVMKMRLLPNGEVAMLHKELIEFISLNLWLLYEVITVTRCGFINLINILEQRKDEDYDEDVEEDLLDEVWIEHKL